MPPISFNGIPTTLRVPFVYVEFDNSKAIQGPSLKAYRHLVLGQKLVGGSAPADVPVRVTSAAQAVGYFGDGSMLAHMFEKHFANNKFTETWCIPLADNGAGVAANGTLTFTGPASAAGSIKLYVAGRKLEVAVANGDSANAIAAAVNSAINAKGSYPVSSSVVANVVTLTFKHKGEVGNQVDVRFNYFEGEAFPAGVGCAIVALASGTSNPSLTAAISAMAETQYDIITFPYTDAGSLTAIEAELISRWGPTRQNDGVAITASGVSHSSLITLGNSRNTPHVVIGAFTGRPSSPHEYAAALAAVISFHGNIDPARPFTTLELVGILPEKEEDKFSTEERNLLLFDGISTSYVDAGGKVRMERTITTYQTNPLGAADISYLDIHTVLTLSYLRYDFRNYFLTKYPRHKLANDGTRYGAGQAVITPKVGKAEAIAKFRQWEEIGLVEGFDQFKSGLIVERNLSDPTRLDFYLPPDLVNQLYVTGVQIGFLL